MSIKDSSNEQRSWAETPPTTPAFRSVSGEFISQQNWLEQVADPVQKWVQTFYGGAGSWRIQLKNLLNGTWLGHPVHPMLTDIPLGAWAATLLLDTIGVFNDSEDLAEGADLTLLLGLAGAIGSAAAGITDWSDTEGTDRRVGILHGLLNSGVTVTNIASYALRKAGMRRTGVMLSGLSYLVLAYAASLGGELSYAKGIGVNHVAWEGGSDDFVAVLAENELPENKLTRVDAAGIPAVLLRQGKTIYAIAATCSHLGGPLDEGTVEDYCVVSCPWHGSRFRMDDGSVVKGPAVYAQPTFAVRTRNGQIELRRLQHA